MIALTQATNTEIFAFIAVLAFKLLNRKVLFINRKDNGNSLKVVYFLREQQISRVNYCKIKTCFLTVSIAFSVYKQNFTA